MHQEKPIRPLFVLSIPRSGSTLLQRLLALHHRISTVSEPWILLPLLYSIRSDGCYAEYSHKAAAMAGEDFLRATGLSQNSFVALVEEFVRELYALAAKNGATYFLDKTPRYHLIARNLMESLPDAKFIFLWRNPAAIPASMIEVAVGRRWNLHEYKIDLYRGIASLVDLYSEYQNDSRVVALCYEKLVDAPETELVRLFEFLGLEPKPSSSEGCLNSSALNGRLGDSRASSMGGAVEKDSVEKWKTVMANPIRMYWLKRYVRWIGADRMAVMGYNLNELEREMASIRIGVNGLVGDLAGIMKGLLSNTFEAGIFYDKSRQPAFLRVPHR